MGHDGERRGSRVREILWNALPESRPVMIEVAGEGHSLEDLDQFGAFPCISEVFWWGVLSEAIEANDRETVVKCFSVIELLIAENDKGIEEALWFRVLPHLANQYSAVALRHMGPLLSGSLGPDDDQQWQQPYPAGLLLRQGHPASDRASRGQGNRTAAGVTWLAEDQHGTQSVAIDAVTQQVTQQVTQRYQSPFGVPRGTNPTWVNSRGFVGRKFAGSALGQGRGGSARAGGGRSAEGGTQPGPRPAACAGRDHVPAGRPGLLQLRGLVPGRRHRGGAGLAGGREPPVAAGRRSRGRVLHLGGVRLPGPGRHKPASTARRQRIQHRADPTRVGEPGNTTPIRCPRRPRPDRRFAARPLTETIRKPAGQDLDQSMLSGIEP